MSSSTNDTMSSSPGSDRGSGFSMKTIVLSVVFALFAASPISAGMMMPGMGMDPMMGMGMGMPGMGMGMPPMGMGMPPMGMGMGSPYGYHWKRGRRYGLFGLRRRRGHWKRNNPYRMMGPGMGMGMPGMMGPGMGMGMGMPPMGMPSMGMDPMMGMGMPGMGMGVSGMSMSMGMPPMGMGMPPMGMGMGSPYGYHWKRGRRYGLFGLRRRRGHWKRNNPYRMMGPGMGMGMPGMMGPGMGMGMGGPMF